MSHKSRSRHLRAHRHSSNRRRLFEQLESRHLMASDWQNFAWPADVNADNAVTPLDALQIINQLNATGSGKLPALASAGHPAAFYDTSGDGLLTPLDALLVINILNASNTATSAPQPLTVDFVPVNATTFLASYSQAMGESAVNPANYSIRTDDGTYLQVVDAVRAQGESVVQLTTMPQTSSSSTGYTVNVQNVTSQSGQMVFFEGRKLLTGNPKGAVVSVAATSSTRVVVVFNEAMADNALAPQNYLIKDMTGKVLLVTDAEFDGPLGMVVVLTTEAQAKVPYQLNALNITDLQNDGLDIKIGNFTGIAAPSLQKAVATTSNKVVLTFTGPVGDSALSPSTYRIEELNASGVPTGVTIPITQANFLGSQRTVVELVTGMLSGGRYRITPTNALTDTTGTPIPATAVEFQGIAGQPKLVSITPSGNNTILLTFDQPMSDDVLSPASYVIKNAAGDVLQVLNAQFIGTERRLVQLITNPQGPSTYNFQTINVTGLNGSQVVAPTGPSATFQGAPAPSLSSATPTDSTHIILTFGGAVGDSALSPSAYKIERLDGSGAAIGTLPITSAVFIGGQRTVVSLTAAPQANATYRITTTAALTDAVGATLPIVQLTFQGIASQPMLVGASSTSPKALLFTFSLPMSDDALSPSSYVIKNAAGEVLPIVSVQFVGTERRIVQLTTGPQSAGIYNIISIGATDTGGNAVTIPAAIGGIQGSPAPALGSVTPTDPTHIVLTFGGSVGDSALSPSSYKIEKLDGSGNVIGALAITSAAFVGGQRTVVSLTTAEQASASYRLSTTSALTDVGGTSLAIVQLPFQGIGKQPPTLIAATSTGATTMLLTFTLPMSDDALSPAAYVIHDAGGNQLPILNVKFVGTERRVVELTTGPQTSQNYTIVTIHATASGGSGTAVIPSIPAINTIPGNITGQSNPVDAPPRVVGAASLSNTSVLVAFSEPMADNAINTSHYFIVQQNVNSEVGYVPILSAVFASDDHRSVLLTTASQNELTYSITAVNVTDLAGNTLAPAVLASGQRVDPNTAQFPGTPPSGTQIVDTDEDGLSDNIEVRGWTVTVTLLNGSTVTRQVTSDPNNPDSDGDELPDAQELNLGIDPRAADTDGDQLSDWAEFNEIYSDPTNQDSDGDTLDDFLEFGFFKTSPYLADSDGDQMDDAYEILGNRNARVSDLPRPEISVGEVNLQLDVRFVETNDQQRRDLETKSVSSSLSQGASQSFSRSDTVNVEAHMGVEFGYGDGQGDGNGGGFFRANVGGSLGYTFSQSAESATETQQAYESSLSTDKEVTRGFSVERRVEGAVMQVAIDLRNLSSISYRVKNLQVTAFLQDPQDHSRVTPVATLLPDSEPEEGFTLGALSKDRGPFIFSNSTIIPSLVESLMANSSGLIFRISNYDIIDESGRNFAFTSQEIVERTARMVIDYGGASSLRALLGGQAFDELQPGDESEIYRVATSAGNVIDTNFDGAIDDADRRAVFDGSGKEVGITLFEAMAAVGLTQYEESETPTGTLSDDEVLNSFSTFTDDAGRERIFRIRGVSNDVINQKYWEILTPLGIDQVAVISNLILKTNSPVSLNFVQDLDKDGLSADVEYFLRTTDSPMARGAEVPGTTEFATDESVTFSTDPNYATGAIVRLTDTGGGLNAGTNYFVRNLGRGSYSFFDTAAHAAALASTVGRVNLTDKIFAGIYTAATPTSTNTTAESVMFSIDPRFPTATVLQVTASGGGLTAGTNYFVRNLGGGSYSFYDSAFNATASSDVITGRVDLTGNITAGIFSPTAKGRDTDGDGLDDRFEALIGWTVHTPQRSYRVYSSPNRADSNFDAPKPGADSDADLIEDRVEYAGTDLFAAPAGWEDKLTLDMDGDGVLDAPNGLRDRFEVFQLALLSVTPDYVLDPIRKDTDSDGINDATEVIGFRITPITGETPYFVSTNPVTPYTDSDTFTDGLERLLGLDPTNGADTDEDGDGLPDPIEELGWNVYVFGLSDTAYKQGVYAPGYNLPVAPHATDLVSDIVSFNVASAPNVQRFALVQVTGGGLLPNTPYFLGKLVEQPSASSVQFALYASATDAAGGTMRGALDLTANLTGIQLAQNNLKQARTDAVDSDGDGMTDYEEFFAGTDPSSVDSDRDGLEDRIEFLGYSLGHPVGENNLGIIKTNPLDADFDNDKRSDGAEAELVDIELARWVVRTEGKTPYRVYSDPLFADADFDGVVDGDEFSGAYRTDPNNGNTDGDQFDDGQELAGGTNPLKLEVNLFRVTVYFNSVQVTEDGDWDSGDEGGDFAFDFGVRLPGTGPGGLSNTFTSVIQDTIVLDGPFQWHLDLDNQQVEPYLPNPGGQNPARSQGSLQNNQYSRGIAFEEGATLNLARYLPTAERSISFWMTESQTFSVEGILAELDANGENDYDVPDGAINDLDSPSTYAVFYNYMGGIDGLQAREKGDTTGTSLRRPVFRGSELQTMQTAFVDYTIASSPSDQLGTRGGNGDAMAGTLSFTIFVG